MNTTIEGSFTEACNQNTVNFIGPIALLEFNGLHTP